MQISNEGQPFSFFLLLIASSPFPAEWRLSCHVHWYQSPILDSHQILSWRQHERWHLCWILTSVDRSVIIPGQQLNSRQRQSRFCDEISEQLRGVYQKATKETNNKKWYVSLCNWTLKLEFFCLVSLYRWVCIDCCSKIKKLSFTGSSNSSSIRVCMSLPFFFLISK